MAREALMWKVRWQEGMGKRMLPVVTLEEFFEGNEDEGSIGCNLLSHPGIAYFYQLLRTVREREDVQDVLVEVSDYEDLDEEDEEPRDLPWPFSERVYVLTSAPLDAVGLWLQPLAPDNMGEGYFEDKPPAAPVCHAGIRPVSAWWD